MFFRHQVRFGREESAVIPFHRTRGVIAPGREFVGDHGGAGIGLVILDRASPFSAFNSPDIAGSAAFNAGGVLEVKGEET